MLISSTTESSAETILEDRIKPERRATLNKITDIYIYIYMN